ncbi:MarR family winged helix-turn-helix transcriptional regulator [Brachybacterium hainanense]|uniref:MarR family winged helix-turn-helix transcriptional regulator n=1 Tax=Brachybacterium hainanense TaxID=1541174 RepID=A0ABV6RHU4_9MICO
MSSNSPADEVDRIVDGWARARPDLDTSPLAVLSRISRLARHLETARRAAFTASGLEGWEFDVLSALRRDGEQSASPSALMHQTLVTSGTMTTRIDKLVARGLVHRSRDPQDRRSVLITLEPAGVELVDAAMERLLAAERELLAALPPAQRDALAAVLRDLLLPFEPGASREAPALRPTTQESA